MTVRCLMGVLCMVGLLGAASDPAEAQRGAAARALNSAGGELSEVALKTPRKAQVNPPGRVLKRAGPKRHCRYTSDPFRCRVAVTPR